MRIKINEANALKIEEALDALKNMAVAHTITSPDITKSVEYYMSARDDLYDEVRSGTFKFKSAARLFDSDDRVMSACAGTGSRSTPGSG